jgi:hypothetical protein
MVEEFRRELTHLRDRVLYLLDRLDTGDYSSSGGKVEDKTMAQKMKLGKQINYFIKCDIMACRKCSL